MSSRSLPRRGRGAQEGFTLLEVAIAAVILGLMASSILGGLMYGMKETKRGKMRGAAAAWVQAEIDFLRLQGYDGLSDDVTASPRTVTPSGGYTTFGSLSEPTIPPSFDRAVINVQNVSGLDLRQITITVYETPASNPYTIVKTYVADYF